MEGNMQKSTKTKITACIFISLFVLICVLSIYVIVLGIEATVRLQGTGHVIDSYWNTARAVMTFVMFSVIILASAAGIAFCCFKLKILSAETVREKTEEGEQTQTGRKKCNLAILICAVVIIVAFVCRVMVDLF